MEKAESVAFGGGCFWCTEAVFLNIKGVLAVTSGYAGGSTKNPTYESVSGGETGHAEVIKIEYYPDIISFQKLLEVFFASHDPTTLNKQGNDVGTQYRSIILYQTENQKNEAELFIKILLSSGKYEKPILTEIKKLDVFYPAEEYHERYYERHPDELYVQAIITPKIEKIKKEFKEIFKG